MGKSKYVAKHGDSVEMYISEEQVKVIGWLVCIGLFTCLAVALIGIPYAIYWVYNHISIAIK